MMDYIGRGSIEHLFPLLSGKVLVMTRESLLKRYGEVLSPLLRREDTVFYTDINPNPSLDEIREAQQKIGGQEYACIVALGGGSVIDFAKAFRHYEQSTARLIAIPTTAGTGSEATQFSVIYMEGVKQSLDAPELLPDVSIVDSQFIEDSPRYLKACCAMDALCQAIESYWAKGATEQSRQWAIEAIELCREHLVHAVLSADKQANEGMAKASHLAGKAINISRTTAAHALSYKITSRYGIPHGHAVALSIAGLFRANLPTTVGKDELLRALGIAEESIEDHFFRLTQSIGMETRLPLLGIEDVDDIVDSVNPQRLGNNPTTLSREQMKQLFLLQ